MRRRDHDERDAELRAEVRRELEVELRRDIETQLRSELEAEYADRYEAEREAEREERETWDLTMSILSDMQTRRARTIEALEAILEAGGRPVPAAPALSPGARLGASERGMFP